MPTQSIPSAKPRARHGGNHFITPQEAASLAPSQLLHWYAGGQHDPLLVAILRILEYFEMRADPELSPGVVTSVIARGHQDCNRIADFLHVILFILSQPDFSIPEKYAAELVRRAPLLGNLAAATGFRNTDAHLRLATAETATDAGRLACQLLLANATSYRRPDLSGAAQCAPQLTESWRWQYGAKLGGYPGRRTWNNLVDHVRLLASAKEEAPLPDPGLYAHFYALLPHLVPVEEVATLRRRINHQIQTTLPDFPRKRKARPGHIGIVSGRWGPRHAAYRGLWHFVEMLGDAHPLTLIHLGDAGPTPLADEATIRDAEERRGRGWYDDPEMNLPEPDTAAFHDKRSVVYHDGQLDLSEIVDHDFEMLLFPEIGPDVESILLSNLRIAPIQVAGPFLHDSTFGAAIDYWLLGEDAFAPDHPWQLATEQVLLLRGLGFDASDYSIRSTYGREGRRPVSIVNCPWPGAMLNAPEVERLAAVQQALEAPILAAIHPGSEVGPHANMQRVIDDVRAQLPRAEMHLQGRRLNYLAAMEHGDFTLDPSPISHVAAVIDSLLIGVPVVSRRSHHPSSQIVAHLVRLAGQSSLLASTDDQLTETALRLIRDDRFRRSCTESLLGTDRQALFHHTTRAVDFVAALDQILSEHSTWNRGHARHPRRLG